MNKKEDLIFESLVQSILNGKLAPGSKIPSEYELAELWHVNKQTANKAVSRLAARGLVIRQKGRGGTIVSEKKHVPKGVIGYRLSLLSGGLFCAKLLKGAERAARSHNYALQYIEWRGPEDEHWQQIARAPLSGVMMTSSALPHGLPFPLFSIDPRLPENSLYSDDREGGRLAAELLYTLGHRKIIIITDKPAGGIPGRIEGFCEKMRSYNVEIKKGQIFRFSPSLPNYMDLLWKELQHTYPGTTAAFCSSDNIALKFYHHLTTLNIHCPRDFSIVGYGAMPMCNAITELTTIDQFPEDMGYTACEKLIALIEGRLPEPVRILTPVKLINYGGTAGPVPSKVLNLK